MTPADEAAVWPVQLRPGARALVTQRAAPTCRYFSCRKIFSAAVYPHTRGAGAGAVHGVAAGAVLAAALVLAALAVAAVGALLLALQYRRG